MTDFLGYEKFFAHGGDWGAAVTLQLGHKYSEIVPASPYTYGSTN